MYEEFVVKQRIRRFGMAPGDVGGLPASYGWVEREQTGVAEYRVRRLEPVGCELPASGLERFVFAEKR
ncbi:hypothetical protein [Streptosporangium fragile]